jgi:pyruvate/2-oxoglutarate dehydrogenase complex dihydrolipoamide dehydrogenase (E3) component
MSETIDTDVCIIGAGAAGLSVAAGAALLGARTVLIEKGEMGGDCLNYGCVPSKALLAAAHRAQAMRSASKYGIAAVEPAIDFARVHAHVRGVIDEIAPVDSAERFAGLGATVLRGTARFIARDKVAVNGTTLRAKRFVLAVGGKAAVPPIPGLAETPFYTNETIFTLSAKPERLLIIGGGPIGVEMAQAHAALGSDVTIVTAGSILGRDDPEMVDLLRRRLRRDGITIVENAAVERVHAAALHARIGETVEVLPFTHLLVAAGRRANVEALAPQLAGVETDKGGILVDRRLRTTNSKIFALGDCVSGGPQFTHAAGYQAGIVIRNVLFRLPAKVDYGALPRVTYTAPELASVGMSEAEARAKHGADIRILRWAYAENDRARAERELHGHVKAIVTPKGVILGATVLGASAGELIQPWVLAMSAKLKIGALANMIAPYPTLGEVTKRAAGSFYTPQLFSARTKKLVRFLLRWA